VNNQELNIIVMKKFFVWKEEYNLEIDIINAQHKKLVDIINRLYQSFIDKNHNNILADIIDELIDYTKYHFSVEEEYFAKHNYQKAKEHILYHRDFVRKISEFKADVDAGKMSTVYKMMTFLQDWLVNHIIKEDVQYVPALKGKV